MWATVELYELMLLGTCPTFSFHFLFGGPSFVCSLYVRLYRLTYEALCAPTLHIIEYYDTSHDLSFQDTYFGLLYFTYIHTPTWYALVVCCTSVFITFATLALYYSIIAFPLSS